MLRKNKISKIRNLSDVSNSSDDLCNKTESDDSEETKLTPRDKLKKYIQEKQRIALLNAENKNEVKTNPSDVQGEENSEDIPKNISVFKSNGK